MKLWPFSTTFGKYIYKYVYKTNTQCSGQERMKNLALQNQVRWFLSVSFIIERFFSFNFYPVLKIPLGLKIRSCCPIIDQADLYISVVLLGLVCKWHWWISVQFGSLHFSPVCCSTWPSAIYPKACCVFKQGPYCCHLPCYKVFSSSNVVSSKANANGKLESVSGSWWTSGLSQAGAQWRTLGMMVLEVHQDFPLHKGPPLWLC